MTEEPTLWPFGEPQWACDLRAATAVNAVSLARIERKVNKIMALSDDLTSAISDLTSTATSILAEDGQVLAIVQDLATKSQGGSVSDADVQAAINQITALRSQVQSQTDSLLSAAQSADPSFTPSA